MHISKKKKGERGSERERGCEGGGGKERVREWVYDSSPYNEG
mgnify:CR=1 FL=1